MPRRRVRWIDDQRQFEQLCRDLCGERVIGFDVETKLDCRTWCLAQFGTWNYTAIVDMLSIRYKDPVRWVLENPGVIKAIHNSSFERNVLRHHSIGLARVFDTLTHSRMVRGRHIPKGHNLSAVCRRELGFGLNKVHWNSDWVSRPLPSDQFYYAALDAEVLLDLYDIFSKELHARNERLVIV